MVLSFPKSVYTEYEDLKNYVYPFYHLLKLCLDVQRSISVWQDGSFDQLNYEDTYNIVEKFHKELSSIYKGYRKKLRQAQDENLPIRFKGTVDDPDILNWPAPLKLCGTALRLIEQFKPLVNVMKTICNPCLRKRHWNAMSEIAGVDVTPNAGTTLKKMMKIDFQSKLNDYEIISIGATKEKQLEDELSTLNLQWKDVHFVVDQFKNISVLKHLDKIGALINDQTIVILVIKSSVFMKPNEKIVTRFHNQLENITIIIDIWQELQSQLIKFVPLFRNTTLKDLIPTECQFFNDTMNIYDSLIDLITKTPEVIKIAADRTVIDFLKTCMNNLEVVHKGVTQYLENVKTYFSRFYFLPNDELIEAVAKSNYTTECKNILRKVFQAIDRLNIEMDDKISGITNKNGESFNFVTSVEVKNESFEQIFSKILNEMRSSLKHQLVDCYKIFKKTEIKLLLPKYPVQIIQIVGQIHWTEQIETALSLNHSIKLRFYYGKLKKSLSDKINSLKTENITNLEKMKLQYLIINDFNNKAVIKKILEEKATQKNNFDWECYIKYYYNDRACLIKTLDIKLKYMFEYLGIPQSLVCTSSTDRCCRTLINAFHLYLNGFITGFEESGKTETVIHLAAAFGIFIKFYRCSTTTLLNTLRNFLKAGTMSGSWIFLKNFSNLPHELMSSLAQDVYSILNGKKTSHTKCLVGEKLIPINRMSFVIATVKTGNYNKIIPQNLKMHFRTVTMLKPDLQLICEAYFLSCGFKAAKLLSQKLFFTLDVCKNLLDIDYFGLRKIKVILDFCDRKKLLNVNEDEDSILCNSLRSLFEGKIKEDDEKTFDNILKNIFPNSSTTSKTNCMKNLDEVLDKMGLLNYHTLSEKIENLCNIISRQENIIITGRACSGKTTLLKISKIIFEKVKGKRIECRFLNPNSLNLQTLYGQLNDKSKEWKDGIITKLIRNKQLRESYLWIIFDGSINNSWADNIITLLEKKPFFTPTGEMLLKSDKITSIFEVKQLNDCTPSIVSIIST